MQTDYEYYIENWLESVRDITIPSKLIPLEDSELDLLVQINEILSCRYFTQLKQLQKLPEQEDRVPLGWENWLLLPELKESRERGGVFEKLVKKVDQAFGPKGRYFAKMSLRSAKDSLSLKKKERKIEAELSKKGFKHVREESYRLGLVVENALQVIQQLSTSQRIVDDIQRHFKAKNGGKVKHIHIALRPWLLIPHCLEFRIFVCQRILTAISAYYKNELYPFLAPFKQSLQRNIVKWFQANLKKQLPMESCVLDIGFSLQCEELALDQKDIVDLLKKQKFKIVLIEINPFGKCSGSALFSWLEPVLTMGPLEFRLSHEEHLL